MLHPNNSLNTGSENINSGFFNFVSSVEPEFAKRVPVEDVGICLGKCVLDAVGDKAGITRYGSMTLPMEETLLTSALDLSGRVIFVYNVSFETEKIGEFDAQLVEEFWNAVASNALMNLHLVLHHGRNSHHVAEAVFKATARAMRQAVTIDPRQSGVPSTKGSL
jgi:imidazoleglycerol-phosphate dehydratase